MADDFITDWEKRYTGLGVPSYKEEEPRETPPLVQPDFHALENYQDLSDHQLREPGNSLDPDAHIGYND
jgi:hypothetical protein